MTLEELLDVELERGNNQRQEVENLMPVVILFIRKGGAEYPFMFSIASL